MSDSLSTSPRRYIDVYRRFDLTIDNAARIVTEALSFVGSDYHMGDLLLGAAIVSTGSFLFRRSEAHQLRWRDALQSLQAIFRDDPSEHAELVTCVGLVTIAFCRAGHPIQIDLTGLRHYQGAALTAGLRDLAEHTLPAAKNADEAADVCRDIQRFQARYQALTGRQVEAWLPAPDQANAKALRLVAWAGRDWSAGLVTPRDLMQSPQLRLVGTLAI